MEQTAVEIFISDTKKDLNELFDRVRKIEMNSAVNAERDKQLLEKMDNLGEFFKSHDIQEMKKYNELSNDVARLTKVMYITIGIGILLSFIGIDNLKLLLGGH